MNDWDPSRGLLLAAGAIVVATAFAWWWEPQGPAPVVATPAPAAASAMTSSLPTPASAPARAEAATPTVAAVAAPAGPAPAAAQTIVRTRNPDDDTTPDLADYVNQGERPTMVEVIQRLQQAGVQGGLAAFPAPGTRPPLIGLAVPADYVLPDGYVRHHQTTDDGQSIEAILMFAPDRQFLDAAGQPVSIPEHRVVPPELAPPGFSQRFIVVPPPADARRPGS